MWNKVKINPVVKYDWEQRRYVGNLIAVHLNRTHVAYVLRGIGNSMLFYDRFFCLVFARCLRKVDILHNLLHYYQFVLYFISDLSCFMHESIGSVATSVFIGFNVNQEMWYVSVIVEDHVLKHFRSSVQNHVILVLWGLLHFEVDMLHCTVLMLRLLIYYFLLRYKAAQDKS